MNSLADFIGAYAVLALAICTIAVSLMSWGACCLGLRAQRERVDSALPPGTHLSLSPLGGVLIAAIAWSLFAMLAAGIHARDGLVAFDERLATALREHVEQATLEVFAALTHLGDRAVTLAVGAAVLIVFCIRRWWWHALVWLLASGGGGLLITALKQHFERERPLHDHALTETASWSFPSGHAGGAVLVYGMLSYMVVRHTPRRWHAPIMLATIALILVVGFSRVILHVHFFSDVLAGFAVASGWVALWIAAFEMLQRRRYGGARHTV